MLWVLLGLWTIANISWSIALKIISDNMMERDRILDERSRVADQRARQLGINSWEFKH